MAGDFGHAEEEAIVALAIDHPDFFISVSDYITIEMFSRTEVKVVMAVILNLLEKHATVPTRSVLWDVIARHLTVDDPYEKIKAIVATKLPGRDLEVMKSTLSDWVKHRAYGLLYSDEAVMAYQQREYAVLDGLVERAGGLARFGTKVFWFFDQYHQMLEESNIVRYKTGYNELDGLINHGGPSPGETLILLAATNVGKSMVLCNLAMNSVVQNLDTLYVTLEMVDFKVAARMLGIATGVDLQRFTTQPQIVSDRCERLRNSTQAQLVIAEMPPNETHIGHIQALIRTLQRQHNWTPKVICIDYLELLVCRPQLTTRNDSDYQRQRYVATDVCGLGKKENCLVYSATQGNRSSLGGSEVIDLDKIADSYGKAMPVDYVISLNQTEQELQQLPARMRGFVAKNRNGPKYQTIHLVVNYQTMRVESHFLS